MKSIFRIAAVVFASASAHASFDRTDFSGNVFEPDGTGFDGSFVGVLIADWTTGVVTTFYVDVSWNSGEARRLSIFDDHDVVATEVGGLVTRHWADGHTTQTTVAPANEIGFYVTRYERDPRTGGMTFVPSPDWAMYLHLGYGRNWGFQDNKTVIAPCPNGRGDCWTEIESYAVNGALTYSSTSPVPTPPTGALLLAGLAWLALIPACSRPSWGQAQSR